MIEIPTRDDAGQATRPFVIGLVAMVLLLNFLVVILALVSLNQSRLQYKEQAVVQAENLSAALESSIAGMLNTIDQALQSVVDEAEKEVAQGDIDAASFNAVIARYCARLPDADGVHMANARGDIAYGTGIYTVSMKNVSDRDYFIKLRDDTSGAAVISKPVVSRVTGRWVITLARRVNHRDGSFAGVVYVPVALQRFGDIFASFDLGSSGGISLRDSEMAIIVRRPETLGVASALGQRSLSPEAEAHLKAGDAKATFFTSQGLEGLPKTVSYRRIGSYPLYVIVALAEQDYLAPWRLDQVRLAFLVAVFMVVTMVLARVVFLKWRSEKHGEMALRQAYDELELRVADRTEQLFRANEELTRELFERELAEEKVRQGRNMLAQIVNTIPQSVFWKDRNSVYLGCNTKFAQRAGFASPEGLVGKTDYDLPWLREESDAYRLDDREVMKSNRAKCHIIEQQLQADGSRVWVDTTKIPLCKEDGSVYGVVGVYEDITERKLIEEARDKALTLFETLLNSSPAGIQVFDGITGQCLIANQALVEMVGGSREALLSQSFREIRSWQRGALATVAEQVLADSVTRRVQPSLTTTFGRELDLDVFFSRCDVDGRPHLMTIIVDVTEHKRLELEKKRIEAQMLHVQKLESLGVLAGGIAHDFNNILMVVVGNADLAMSRLAPDSPVYDNLMQIENAATRASDLARQMLAYSGKGRFVIENLDLTRIVREMAQMLEVSISKKVTLKYLLGEAIPAISADATQLRQVILNLVINASEAIGDQSGTVTISTAVHECDRGYLSYSWIDDHLPEGRYVVLEVSDTGCGIDRDIIPKIFDPFFTTKFTGRGLGMAAVLGIVRGHHGAIRVYSEKGKGSTFRVLIPVVQEETEREAALPAPQPLWQGKGTVLLVDDEESIRALGQDMLRELGFNVEVAGNGREAIEIFTEKQGGISCVMLDLTMPELDGEQTFQALRGIDPEVRVIISSGYNQQEVSERLFGHGLAGFIQKPYKLAEMSRKLQEVLA